MESLVELLDFMRDKKPEVRKIAVQTLVQYCGEGASDTLFPHADKLLLNLFSLFSDVPNIKKDALVCVLQLSSETNYCIKMIEKKIVSRIMNDIDEAKMPLVQLDCMILSNVTRIETAARELLQVGTDFEGFYISKLVDRFCEPLPEDSKSDPYQWIASVFANITQIPEGRAVFTNPKNDVITHILPFLRHNSVVRKHGIARTIKNCCLNADAQQWLISISTLESLIIPLIGPGNYNEEERIAFPTFVTEKLAINKREDDAQTKRDILDSILLLTTTRESRDHLRSLNIYPLIREFDLVESDESVKDIILKVIEMMIREEEKEQNIIEIQ